MPAALTRADAEKLFLGLTPSDLDHLSKLGLSYDPKTNAIHMTEELVMLGREVLWLRCEADEEFFLIDSGLVKTLDHQEKYNCLDCGRVCHGTFMKTCTGPDWDPGCGSARVARRSPIQAFPKDLDYLRDLAWAYTNQPKVCVVKSRRMLVSEFTAGHGLHGVMFRQGFFGIYQADREDKANENIQRTYGMWSRLPDWMKARRPANPKRGGQTVELDFWMPSNHARILGLPEGDTQIRMFGPTLYWGDEMAFWPSAMDTYGAVLPAIERGCQMIATSTAAAGFIDGLANDILDQVAA